MGMGNPNDQFNRPITPPPSPDSLVPRNADLLHKHEAEHVYGVKTFHIEPQLFEDKKRDVAWDPKTYATEYQVMKAVQDQLQNVKSKQDTLTAGRLVKLTDEDGDILGNKEHISIDAALVGIVDEGYDKDVDHLGETGANLMLSSGIFPEFDDLVLGKHASEDESHAEEIENLNNTISNLTDQLAQIQEQLAALNGNNTGN